MARFKTLLIFPPKLCLRQAPRIVSNDLGNGRLSNGETRRPGILLFAMLLMLAISIQGCSIRRFAVSKVGDALSQGGTTYESDEDLVLIGDALPFSLKLIESLLAEVPDHRGMLEAACKGFATYSYIYVQHEADLIADEDLDGARAIWERSRRLYLRASRYGFRALEETYPGLTAELATDPLQAVRVVEEEDLSLLYWNSVALGLAVSVSMDDASMLARLAEVDAMIARALEVDETWNNGALHEFQLTLSTARPGSPDYEKLAAHFERAQVLSNGSVASLYVTYAEAVAVPKQDVAQFRSLMARALSVDPDEHEEIRIANLVAQRRARWLLGRMEDLFLDVEQSARLQERSPR